MYFCCCYHSHFPHWPSTDCVVHWHNALSRHRLTPSLVWRCYCCCISVTLVLPVILYVVIQIICPLSWHCAKFAPSGLYCAHGWFYLLSSETNLLSFLHYLFFSDFWTYLHVLFKLFYLVLICHLLVELLVRCRMYRPRCSYYVGLVANTIGFFSVIALSWCSISGVVYSVICNHINLKNNWRDSKCKSHCLSLGQLSLTFRY